MSPFAMWLIRLAFGIGVLGILFRLACRSQFRDDYLERSRQLRLEYFQQRRNANRSYRKTPTGKNGPNAAAPFALQVLGISPSATVEEVKRAYRERVAECHPDRGGDADEFHSLHQAYKKALQYVRAQQDRQKRPG